MAIVVKNPPANAGDIRDKGSFPGAGGSPGGVHGNPLQYSCLENSMDRGVGGLQSMELQSQTRLSNFNFTFTEFSRLVVSDSL